MMSPHSKPLLDAPDASEMSTGLVLVLAAAVGAVVLNLYGSQPLVGLIGPSLGLSAQETGLITTLTLLGYAAGLFLLTPLTDLVENRKAIVSVLAADVIALTAVASTRTASSFLIACFISGVTTSAIQMLVPAAALLSPENRRGQVVGFVMSGLMIGILLSRPIASLMAYFVGWRWFYGGSAVLVTISAAALSHILPVHQPKTTRTYVGLISSMYVLLKSERVLQRRVAYQALCMSAFGIFWTSIALRLSQPPFSLGQRGIAVFALAGAAGAVIAPIAGRAGDKGRTFTASLLAHLAVIIAMLLAELGGDDRLLAGEPAAKWLGISLLVASAILLDLGVIADQTLGRRAINLLRPEARGRLNGLFTGLFFLGAAVGSGLSGFVWIEGGWSAVCALGGGFGFVALLANLTERLRP